MIVNHVRRIPAIKLEWLIIFSKKVDLTKAICLYMAAVAHVHLAGLIKWLILMNKGLLFQEGLRSTRIKIGGCLMVTLWCYIGSNSGQHIVCWICDKWVIFLILW